MVFLGRKAVERVLRLRAMPSGSLPVRCVGMAGAIDIETEAARRRLHR
jgi:hypothetical protein